MENQPSLNANTVYEIVEEDFSSKSIKKYLYEGFCDSPTCLLDHNQKYGKIPSTWFKHVGKLRLIRKENEVKPFECPVCQWPLYWVKKPLP